jgi:hypothetical protein
MNTRDKVHQAAALYKEFSGHTPQSVREVRIVLPKVALLVGECDGIMYTTVRDGRVEHYVHEFAARSRPLLLASHDGKKLVLLGGAYRFTDSGINDLKE